MTPLSANLGFLWAELPLPDAIHKAKAAGFDAVECHWPYDQDVEAVKAALDATNLPMMSLNTIKGLREGDVGLSAQPGREDEARAAIDQAFAYGARIGARGVHIMAGTVGEQDWDSCAAAFVSNLTHACDCAAQTGMIALIEPLNPFDNPDYFLMGIDMAKEILQRVARSELKIMFDCYHLQITDGDLLRHFIGAGDLIGHVQFAGVPDRGRPDQGEIAFDRLLPAIRDAGFRGPFGAEYKPGGDTDATLGWMSDFR